MDDIELMRKRGRGKKKGRGRKKMHCWEGFRRTPNTVAGTKGSCQKKLQLKF